MEGGETVITTEAMAKMALKNPPKRHLSIIQARKPASSVSSAGSSSYFSRARPNMLNKFVKVAVKVSKTSRLTTAGVMRMKLLTLIMFVIFVLQGVETRGLGR